MSQSAGDGVVQCRVSPGHAAQCGDDLGIEMRRRQQCIACFQASGRLLWVATTPACGRLSGQEEMRTAPQVRPASVLSYSPPDASIATRLRAPLAPT